MLLAGDIGGTKTAHGVARSLKNKGIGNHFEIEYAAPVADRTGLKRRSKIRM